MTSVGESVGFDGLPPPLIGGRWWISESTVRVSALAESFPSFIRSVASGRAEI